MTSSRSWYVVLPLAAGLALGAPLAQAQAQAQAPGHASGSAPAQGQGKGGDAGKPPIQPNAITNTGGGVDDVYLPWVRKHRTKLEFGLLRARGLLQRGEGAKAETELLKAITGALDALKGDERAGQNSLTYRFVARAKDLADVVTPEVERAGAEARIRVKVLIKMVDLCLTIADSLDIPTMTSKLGADEALLRFAALQIQLLRTEFLKRAQDGKDWLPKDTTDRGFLLVAQTMLQNVADDLRESLPGIALEEKVTLPLEEMAKEVALYNQNAHPVWRREEPRVALREVAGFLEERCFETRIYDLLAQIGAQAPVRGGPARRY